MPDRCRWCNLKNPLYVEYHDREWGSLRTDDGYLFEMLILESFQAGLSWECVLNKREAFRLAYDGFDLDRVCAYDEGKCAELAADAGIIRNRLKIRASVRNARIFRDIVREYGSFYRYLCSFTGGRIIYETGPATSPLSEAVSKDLYRRGMRFVGSTIIYAYLQAVGIINAHEEECFCNKRTLRRRLKERAVSLAENYFAENAALPAATVLQTPEFGQAGTIFTYVSAPGEPDTRAIIETALSAGKRVCVPKCLDRHRMVAVELHSFD